MVDIGELGHCCEMLLFIWKASGLRFYMCSRLSKTLLVEGSVCQANSRSAALEFQVHAGRLPLTFRCVAIMLCCLD